MVRQPIQRILILRYRFIGDTVLLIPFLRACRERYPDAAIDVVVSPGSGEVLTLCPWITRLIYFDSTRKHQYEGDHQSSPPDTLWSFGWQLRKEQYDLAFVLKRSWSSAILAWLAGCPRRVGFDTEGRRLLLTDPVPYQADRHEAQCFLDVLDAAAPVSTTAPLTLTAWFSDTHQRQAQARLNRIPPHWQTHPKLLIHVTASNRDKCWPPTFWTSLVPWLMDSFDATIHCVGSPADTAAYDFLKDSLSPTQQERWFNHCGQTDLLTSQALIGLMDGVIGVDSGVLHLAAAVNVPIVGLLLPTHTVKWAPLGPHELVTVVDLPKTQEACCRQFNALTERCYAEPESSLPTTLS